MTALTTQYPAVTDYLVAACQGSPALAGVNVIDGPPPAKSVYAYESALWIGSDPSAAGVPVAESAMDWPVLDKARTLDENGAITCTAQHWSGDSTMKTHRDACASIAGAVGLLLRGKPDSGGPGDTTMGGLVFWSLVTGPWEWYQAQQPAGAAMQCVFKVIYYARLTVD